MFITGKGTSLHFIYCMRKLYQKMAVWWQISHSNNRVLIGHCDHNSIFGNLQQMGVYYTLYIYYIQSQFIPQKNGLCLLMVLYWHTTFNFYSFTFKSVSYILRCALNVHIIHVLTPSLTKFLTFLCYLQIQDINWFKKIIQKN